MKEIDSRLAVDQYCLATDLTTLTLAFVYFIYKGLK